MKDSVIEIKDRILKLLDKEEMNQLPKRIVEQNLSTQYDTKEIENAISTLLNDFIVDLVVEYPSEDSDLNTGRPCWFLKLLSNDEKQDLQNLPPLKQSFLRILQETDDEPFPGEIPVEEVKAKLIAKGFPEDKVERIHIADKVDQVNVSGENGMVRCYMIIPEYEKTKEYKKEQKRIQAEFDEKEAIKAYHATAHDLADQILRIVKESPDGISKKEIVKQLFMSNPKYVDYAFSIEIDYENILPITMENGEEGYKLHPEYDDE